MNIKLTDQQTRLLLKLYAKPAAVHASYRPLQALIEHDLVRARHVGRFGTSATYECSLTGAIFAQAIKVKDAEEGRECTCGREWSLKHEPQCPASAKR